MKLSADVLKLRTKYHFRIARGVKTFAENVFLRVQSEGLTGLGEASPNAFYGENAHLVASKLEALGPFLADKPLNSTEDIAGIWETAWPFLSPSRAAQCALDIALWDLLGKKTGRSAADLAWGKEARTLTSSCTFALCLEDEWEARLADMGPCPSIKIKSDALEDLSLPAWITERSSARIRVDANCAWPREKAAALLDGLASLGAELAEQPLPPDFDAEMPHLLAVSPIPLIADESCKGEADVEKLAGRFSGINIKLVKCGGLTPGLRMLRTARRLGMKVMTGCMLESDVLIAAGAVLAQGADYVDPDGSWLLHDRPFTGVGFEGGRLTLSGGPGLGVRACTD